MKKSLLILISFFCLKGFSQSSLLITNITNSVSPVVMSPNDIVLGVTAPNAQTSHDFDIKNTSSTTKSYHVRRYDILLNTVASTTTMADAHFCFGGQCYGSGVKTSLQSLTLTAGGSASALQGSYNILTAELDEATAIGYSYVKYTFFNAANTSDSVQISIKYNAPAGISELNNNALSSFEIFPNPATDVAVLKVTSQKTTEAKVIIYNALGAIVSEQPMAISEGKNKLEINVNDLSSGVYFAQIRMENGAVTKKLVVK
jgi:hypothetical protein